MKEITSIPDLVDALGGPTKLAKWAGYEDARGVCNWTSRGIPPSYHLRLTLEAKRRGLRVNPCVFGLAGKEAEVLRNVLSEMRA